MSSKWRAGPPPSVGWWPASIAGDITSIRWWNGSFWSMGARPWYSQSEAAHWANRKHIESAVIRWTDRPESWPERSRT